MPTHPPKPRPAEPRPPSAWRRTRLLRLSRLPSPGLLMFALSVGACSSPGTMLHAQAPRLLDPAQPAAVQPVPVQPAPAQPASVLLRPRFQPGVAWQYRVTFSARVGTNALDQEGVVRFVAADVRPDGGATLRVTILSIRSRAYAIPPSPAGEPPAAAPQPPIDPQAPLDPLLSAMVGQVLDVQARPDGSVQTVAGLDLPAGQDGREDPGRHGFFLPSALPAHFTLILAPDAGGGGPRSPGQSWSPPEPPGGIPIGLAAGLKVATTWTFDTFEGTTARLSAMSRATPPEPDRRAAEPTVTIARWRDVSSAAFDARDGRQTERSRTLEARFQAALPTDPPITAEVDLVQTLTIQLVAVEPVAPPAPVPAPEGKQEEKPEGKPEPKPRRDLEPAPAPAP